MRPVLAGGRAVELVAVDERVKAELEGARRALEDRQRELVEFVGSAFDDLVLERVADAEHAGKAAQAAYEQAMAASDAWRQATRAWGRVLRLADRADLLQEVEPDPFRELPLDRPGMPAPASLMPREAA